jgi:hypothetical protein
MLYLKFLLKCRLVNKILKSYELLDVPEKKQRDYKEEILPSDLSEKELSTIVELLPRYLCISD